MKEIKLSNISIDKISLPILIEKKVDISILRLDKIHPLISGNKWFKLHYYLVEAKQQNKNTIATYGGAWSNHLLATASACHLEKINCVGIVRGEEPVVLSNTLIEARKLGMQLFFINRTEYKQKLLPDSLRVDEVYIIPEGGYGEPGVRGAAGIVDYFSTKEFSHITCAVGTGTMIAGLAQALPTNIDIVGISALKNNLEIKRNVQHFLPDKERAFTIIHDYHFGGYAKKDDRLIDFINYFFNETGIPSDFVYTGKLFAGVFDLIQDNYFAPGSNILVIHSGGLQGNQSLEKGTLIF